MQFKTTNVPGAASRNQIVLVVVLVLVIGKNFEDENEEEEDGEYSRLGGFAAL